MINLIKGRRGEKKKKVRQQFAGAVSQRTGETPVRKAPAALTLNLQSRCDEEIFNHTITTMVDSVYCTMLDVNDLKNK